MSTTNTLEQNLRQEREFYRYRDSVLIDELTWAAEQLDALFEKPLEYRYHDNELWSEQGQPLGKIFTDSITHYEKLSQAQPELAFQLRRARVEYREYETMLAMARGEAPNTLVVDSPYPSELDGATEDVLGYQVKRRLGFKRVITFEGQGRIKVYSRSFDRSDPRGIEAMFAVLGRSVDWGRDILEQPIALSIDSEIERELLDDRLLLAYDEALSRHYGGKWLAGRNAEQDQREAVDFVRSKGADLLEAHVDALIHVGPKSPLADVMRYDFSAALRRRFNGDTRHQDGANGSAAIEMATAGHEAARAGETASGCGLTIEGKTASEEMEEAGYKLRPGEKKLDECMSCPVCRQLGVWIEQEGGKKDYTCDNKDCAATTKKVSATPGAPSGAEAPLAAPTDDLPLSPTPLIRWIRSQAPTHRREIIIGGVRDVPL